MTRRYNNEGYNNDEGTLSHDKVKIVKNTTKFSTKKKHFSEKQVVDEETLSHDKACKECYSQKQKLINEDD